MRSSLISVAIAFSCVMSLPSGCAKRRASIPSDSVPETSPEQPAAEPVGRRASTPGRAELATQFIENPEAQRPRLDQTVYRIDLDASDPQQGPADALITLVMFGNFEDKFSARAVNTVKTLRAKYGDDLRIVWKHRPLPMHAHSRQAASLAVEAFKQGGAPMFWRLHELLFENMRALDDEDLERYAKQLGLARKGVVAALTKRPHEAKIDRDIAQANRLSEVPTSPEFAVNGRYVRGAQPAALFELLIGEELVKAKALVAAGTARAAVYEKLVERGSATPVQPLPGTVGGPPPRYDLEVPQGAPERGGKYAKVVIQEFCEFECPYCARVQPTLQELLDKYGDQIKVVWRNYPLPNHAHAKDAAQAAMEVYAQRGNDKFWAYHDRLFAEQGALTAKDLERHASVVGGVDTEALRGALDDDLHAGVLASDAQALASLKIRGATPTFLINGKLLQGALPGEAFQVAVERALEEAGHRTAP